MAELLIRIVDKTSPDPVKDLKLSKRCDVIISRPDGWAWTPVELNNPDWIIIKSSMTFTEAKKYEAPQSPNLEAKTPEEVTRDMKFRAIKLNLDSALIPAAIKTKINDSSRVTKIIDVGNFDIKTIEETKTVVKLDASLDN